MRSFCCTLLAPLSLVPCFISVPLCLPFSFPYTRARFTSTLYPGFYSRFSLFVVFARPLGSEDDVETLMLLGHAGPRVRVHLAT